jgi:hypothetical protein
MPLLGYCVYWAMQDFRIPHKQQLENLKKAGIDAKEYLNEASPKSVVTQVLKHITHDIKSQFHKKVVDDKDRAGFTIVETALNKETVDANFQSVTKVIFQKAAKKLVVEGSRKDDIEKKFNEFLNTYTTDQFRTLVLNYLSRECKAIAIRDRGGVYFVPVTSKDGLDKLTKLFSTLPGCDLEILPIVDTAEAKKSMWKALVSDIKGEIAELNEEVAGMVSPSQKVYASRIERFKSLRAKAEMYGDLLSTAAKELVSDIDEIKKRLVEKMPEAEGAAKSSMKHADAYAE